MSVAEVSSMATALLTSLGLMPIIQAAVLITVGAAVLGAIKDLRK